MNPPAGTRCTVMGLGRFGGGLGVTRWLLDQGCEVLLTDLSEDTSLAESLDRLGPDIESGRVRLRLGGHVTSDFTTSDLVIANPAVPRPWSNPYLQAAWEHGVPIASEIRLLVNQLDRSRVIGVTGTNGKSTTASMIKHIFDHCHIKALLGGNIGGSLLPSIQDLQAETWVVLELSSAMLWWLGEESGDGPGWSPGTAVITNISPNHLDWHETEMHYRQCKDNITRWQMEDDLAIHGEHFEASNPIPLLTPGAHNQANAQLAVQVVSRAAGISTDQATLALADFPGLPHRLEPVGDHQPPRFFNDSKSTTPEATVLAVEAFGPRRARVHLIAGGYDKGISLEAITGLVPGIAGLYAIGSTGQSMSTDATGSVFNCGDLANAVREARSRMKEDDILLLSPGCASWDQFDHFEARGELFRKLVSS